MELRPQDYFTLEFGMPVERYGPSVDGGSRIVTTLAAWDDFTQPTYPATVTPTVALEWEYPRSVSVMIEVKMPATGTEPEARLGTYPLGLTKQGRYLCGKRVLTEGMTIPRPGKVVIRVLLDGKLVAPIESEARPAR